MQSINWLDMFSAMDRFLLSMSQQYGVLVYLALFAIYFAETGLVVMAFLPGDSLLFVAGATAAAGAMNVYLLCLVIIVAAVLGNTLNYAIGAWLGKKIYDGSIRWIDRGALNTTHDFFEHHGGKTIMIARFVPVVRSFAPLVAGASGMDWGRFQFYNVIGAAVWVILLVGGGYLFGQLPFIKDNLGIILIVGLLAALLPITIAAIVRVVRGRTPTAEQTGVPEERGN